MTFGENLRKIRNEKNISARELSSKIGYSTNIVYDWEKNRCEPPSEIISKISDILNVSVEFLIGKTDEFGYINNTINERNSLSKQEKELLYKFSHLTASMQEAFISQIDACFNNEKYRVDFPEIPKKIKT